MPDPRAAKLLDLPLHRFLGVELLDPDDPTAGVRFRVDPPAQGPGGWLHGGVVSALMDMTCYLALLPQLAPDVTAVSHAVNVSLMKGVPGGSVVELRAEIVRLGRTIAFLRAEATVDDALFAMGTFTKSLISTGT